MFKSYFTEKNDEDNRCYPKESSMEPVPEKPYWCKRCKRYIGVKSVEDEDSAVGGEDIGISGTDK